MPNTHLLPPTPSKVEQILNNEAANALMFISEGQRNGVNDFRRNDESNEEDKQDDFCPIIFKMLVS